jgi:hypothetical protein
MTPYYAPLCVGTDYSASLVFGLPAGGSVTWTVENGTITSGQGTSTVHFIPTNPDTKLLVTATMAISGCPNSYQDYAPIVAQLKPAQIALSPSTVKVGQPVTINVTANTDYYNVSASPRNDLLTFVSWTPPNGAVWKYTPAASGNVTITVNEAGACHGTNVSATATISVTP